MSDGIRSLAAMALLSAGMASDFGGGRLWTDTNRLKGVPHFFSEKPLSKRAKRRLRGKRKGTA